MADPFLTLASASSFDAPTDWFVYGHLHFILALPTLTLLYLSPPLQTAQPLQKQAAYAFVGFIVVVGVMQSYIWDAYGATLGIWEFNPAKCTLRESFPLPVEEVLWLFHHVTKTALYQLKAFELVPANTAAGAPSPALRGGVSALLVAAIAFGVYALAFSPEDSVKCVGLVCAFFAPVWLLVWRAGGQFVLRHADRITWGWIAPGITTTLIDCLGQQQGVWRFPAEFLSGVGYGYLKLDIVLVYMVSTFAVTASGAVVLAATEELLARRQALREAGLPVTTEARALGIDLGRYGEEASLWDVAKYIFSGSLSVGEESDALGYDVRCGLDGCVIDDVPLPAGVD
uniref:Uncharacterized protein n=2 Tax=Haptolina ericina TaxID=156174 RepID=A0A7S3C4B3_9EUKA